MDMRVNGKMDTYVKLVWWIYSELEENIYFEYLKFLKKYRYLTILKNIFGTIEFLFTFFSLTSYVSWCLN